MKPLAGLIAVLAYSTILAQAQGVPTQATAGLGPLVARLLKLGEDLAT